MALPLETAVHCPQTKAKRSSDQKSQMTAVSPLQKR